MKNTREYSLIEKKVVLSLAKVFKYLLLSCNQIVMKRPKNVDKTFAIALIFPMKTTFQCRIIVYVFVN